MPRNRLTAAFERRVARALDRLVAPGMPVLVACSGGADSSAALIAAARSGRPVAAAHFDHRLRTSAEAIADRAAVAALTDTLDISLHCGAGSGVSAAEESARQERYHWLATAASAAGVTHVVTGHTLDDQAETVLFRLARGAGLTGAAGMAESAPWPMSMPAAPRVVRPLLRIERREVEAYLAALGVEPRHDPTNADPAYSRNHIRHRVLPELAALNPRVIHALAAFADRAAHDDQTLTAWAEATFADLASIQSGRIVVARPALRALPVAVRVRVLRSAAAHLGVRLDAAHIHAIEHALRRTGVVVRLPGTRLSVAREHVILERLTHPVDARTDGA